MLCKKVTRFNLQKQFNLKHKTSKRNFFGKWKKESNVEKETTDIDEDDLIIVKKGTKIDDILPTVKFPVKVIGTRKRGINSFLAWDANISLIRDMLNPDIYLTFQDQEGKVIGPICYASHLETWGFKPEFSLRWQMGRFKDLLDGVQLDEIPKRIDVEKGWDAGFGWVGLGTFSSLTYSRFYLKQFPNSRLEFFGLGGAYGYTKFKSGYFERDSEIASEGIPARFKLLEQVLTGVWMALVFLFIVIMILVPYYIFKMIKEALEIAE